MSYLSTRNVSLYNSSITASTLKASAITYSTMVGSTITTSSIVTPAILGTVTLGQNVSYPNRFVELGTDTTNSMYLDFHSNDASLPDYSTRIQSLGGGTTGTGVMNLYGSTIGIMAPAGVGIGTNNPTNPLHIYTGNASPFMMEQSSTTANYMTFKTNGTVYGFFGLETSTGGGLFGNNTGYGMSIGTPTATNFNIATNNLVRATITSGGSVGIGITVPAYTLHIVGNAYASTAIYSPIFSGSLYMSNADTYQTSGVQIINSSSGSAKTYQFSVAGTSGWGTVGTLGIYNGSTATFSMCISPTGYVGIGTTNPNGKFEIYGGANNAHLRITDENNNGSSSTFYYPVVSYYARQDTIVRTTAPLTGTNGASASIVFTDRPGTYYTFPTTVRNSDILFYTADNILSGTLGIYPKERMRITAEGTVGIGTTIPSAILHVMEAPVNGDVTRKNMFYGQRYGTASVQNSVSMAFALGANVSSINPYGALDIKLNGLPVAGNTYGIVPDVTVMSIIGNGNVGIGTTSPASILSVQLAGTGDDGKPATWSASNYVVMGISAGSSTGPGIGFTFNNPSGYGCITCCTPGGLWLGLRFSAAQHYFNVSGTLAGYIVSSGFTNASDEREKINIKPINTAKSLQRIMACSPKTFQRVMDRDDPTIPDSDKEKWHIGLIAQEVLSINPHCISEWKKDNGEMRYGITYTDFITHLIGSTQELSKQITEQATTISEQATTISTLQAQLAEQSNTIASILARLTTANL